MEVGKYFVLKTIYKIHEICSLYISKQISLKIISGKERSYWEAAVVAYGISGQKKQSCYYSLKIGTTKLGTYDTLFFSRCQIESYTFVFPASLCAVLSPFSLCVSLLCFHITSILA